MYRLSFEKLYFEIILFTEKLQKQYREFLCIYLYSDFPDVSTLLSFHHSVCIYVCVCIHIYVSVHAVYII